MTIHQYDTKKDTFNVPTDVASDFLFFLSEILGAKKNAYYLNDAKDTVVVQLEEAEIEELTDWIMNFNLTTRKPAGLIMPDLYLDEEKIRSTTVTAYCSHIAEFIYYMITKQNLGREKIGQWAASNFTAIYMKADSKARQLMLKANKS